ncbi:hypothetical protein ALON55S_05007 [Alishewanella longhuensis]
MQRKQRQIQRYYHQSNWNGQHIQRTLEQFDGNVSHTARALGMHRRALQRKLLKRRPEKRIEEI